MIATALLIVVVGIVLGVWIKLRRVFKQARPNDLPIPARAEADFPSVSLCIPARNETHAMTDCLESALRSSYPKLEIIVLDDGSRDDTSALIKSFAYAGVRFVEGSPLPDGWLGKNHALQGLADQASGSLLLFADVDTRFAPDSIARMVAYMMRQSADMLSVLPTRHNPDRASAIFATMRHFWNLLGHTSARPAVASSAWMIRRELLLHTLHGFEQIKMAVRPEKSLAAAVAKQGTYRFLISSAQLGVSYEKKLSSQYETAIRIYYPDFGAWGVALRVAGIAICLSQYVVFVALLLSGELLLALLLFAGTVILSIVNAWYLSLLRLDAYGIASICLPFILAREAWLLIASVVMYKTGRVTWKGRPIQTKR